AGGRSTTDESKVDVNETPDAAQGTTKMEISPSSESIKGNRKVVKKSTFNSGNTTINIEKVENLLLGDLDRNVPAVKGARKISGMIEDLTAEATSDETEMDIKDTDMIQSEQTVLDQGGCDLAHFNQQQTGKVSGEPHVTGAGQKATLGEEFAKGRNELLSQIKVRELAEHMESVGALIYKGDVIGTVFRAGDSFVFTARHVLRKIIDIYQNGQYDYTLLERENVCVNFNASVAEPACVVYRVCHEFSSNDPNLDFAVLRITNPVQLPKKMFLDKYSFDRLQARMLSGIGYGHPEQDSKCKKSLDPNCQIINAIIDRIRECRAWLEENFIYYQNAVRHNGINPELVDNSYIGIDTVHNIFLDITMQHGGSGSPFLDNNGRVVGILTHGHPEFCFKLPMLIQLNFPKEKKFESVLRLDYVYNHIVERDPELAGKLFGY
ncbi:uncharacterized protein LOC128554927, partial [Mercenaria mercenaria]|uniref:uncharacterized protein LOC128554927 n=1 Tax=Mercenaria mercenaria TaxID=6596 RepID=UPI00234F8821